MPCHGVRRMKSYVPGEGPAIADRESGERVVAGRRRGKRAISFTVPCTGGARSFSFRFVAMSHQRRAAATLLGRQSVALWCLRAEVG